MSDKSTAWDDNVPGKWYVDKNCILCSLCSDVAPDNFKESSSGDHDHVFKQPENDDEAARCKDAMAQCPVEAIGNDRE